MDWFRSWHNAPTDTKWLLIARRAKTVPGIVGYVFWSLEDYASQNTDRGSVKGFDIETCAAYSGFDEATITAIIAALTEKGVITQDERLAAWEKRQPKREDDSTERVRLLRERERLQREANAAVDDVTQCNAEERTVTPSNAPDKIREETDKEKSITTPPVDDDDGSLPLDPAFGRVCDAYHANIGVTTKIISDQLKDDLATYGADWIVEAIGIATKAEKRNLSYVEGILKRWRTEGKTNGRNGTGAAADPYKGAREIK